MSVLAVIPARGGSKGIPRKNIRELGGKPLIAWTIHAARSARTITRAVVSTDDQEIAQVARLWGADVPFLRPAELATDSAAGVAVAVHAAGALSGFEWVVLLQPTSPLRVAADIDGIIQHCKSVGAPAAVSVCASPIFPEWMFRMGVRSLLSPVVKTEPEQKPRQELAPTFVLNGALYLARIDWLIGSRSFVTEETVGYEMPFDRSVDIDTLADWAEAESLIGRKDG
jgi:N-acylneuraminate cytidylyltransferase